MADEPKNFKAIMLSSTFTDLKEHREAANEAIVNYGYMPRSMEFSGANAAADVIDTSLQMVRDAVAYVGIVGLKYGQTPDDPDRNPDGLSITELEFNEAMRLGRPIVLFIMSDDHDVKKAYIESDPDKQKKLDAFRDRAKRMRSDGNVHRVYETFGSLEKFSSRIAIAIGNLARDLDQAWVRASVSPVRRDVRPPRAISNIPVTVPFHFLGRDADLAAIDHALRRGDGRAAVTALHGLRGVGKTTLAAAYAERHSENYRAMWWIRAETDATMRADLAGLGVQLGWATQDSPEEAAVKAVLERLPHEGENVLLVYDNAMDARNLVLFLPRSAGPRIIITSNAPNWGGVASPVEIAVWPKNVGADFLIARTNRPREREAALALSEALGGLPLAHEQAAAYCDRVGVALADYARRLKAAPAAMFGDDNDAAIGYGRTVAKTFTLAIGEATKLHPAAQPLIRYAALLAPEPIPLYLFSEASESFSEPLASMIGSGGLDEVVATLRAFALVQRESIPDEREPSITTDCIRLHRIVRDVIVADGAVESDAKAKAELISAMAAVYPRDVLRNPAVWPLTRRLDAIAMALVANDVLPPPRAEIDVARVLQGLAAYRQGALAAVADARSLIERAHSISEAVLGPDHPDTAFNLNAIGYLLREQGDFTGALSYYKRALAIREMALGPEHPITAVLLNNLGGLMAEMGDLAEARRYYERALDIRTKALGVEHADTAASLSNLGALMRHEGDLSGARPHLERALAIREKIFGPDHIETANSLNNLGAIEHLLGDLPKARTYLDRALAITEKSLGPDHPNTKIVAANLVPLLVQMKLGAEAQAILQKFGL